MAKSRRRIPDSHFKRHEGVSGFVYVARNPFHPEDVYKIGYTTRQSSQARINDLNFEQRQSAAMLGLLVWVYDKKTLNSYGAEQLAHDALKDCRLTNKEFFKAPIHDIMAAVDMAVKTVDDKQRAKQAKQREDEEAKQEADRKFQNAREINTAAAILETHNPRSYSPQPRQFTKPSSPIEIVDFECPKCGIELTLGRAQTNNAKQLRCMGCKHIFLWSDWLAKQASGQMLGERKDDVATPLPQKLKSDHQSNNIVLKYFVGLFVVLMAFPFLNIVFKTQDKAAITPPVVIVAPAIAPPQTMATQPMPETVAAPLAPPQTQPVAPVSPKSVAASKTSNARASTRAKTRNDKVIPDLQAINTMTVTNTAPGLIYVPPPRPKPTIATEPTEKERMDAQSKLFSGCRWVTAQEWSCK